MLLIKLYYRYLISSKCNAPASKLTLFQTSTTHCPHHVLQVQMFMATGELLEPCLPQDLSCACKFLSQIYFCFNSNLIQFPNLSCFARDILSIPSQFATDLFSLFNHLLMLFLSFLYSIQDLLLLQNKFFQEAMIQFLSAMQASTQRLGLSNIFKYILIISEYYNTVWLYSSPQRLPLTTI